MRERTRTLSPGQRCLLVALLAVVMLLGSGAAAYAGSISGTVSGGGAPLNSGVTVYAYTPDGYYAGSTGIGTDGSYTISALSDGSYKLSFDPYWYNYNNGTNYFYSYYGGTDSSTATLVEVAGGADVTAINIELLEGAQFVGTISGGGGPLGANIYVEISTAAGAYVTGAWTDSTGMYSTGILPAGDYLVSVWPYNYNVNNSTDYLYEYFSNATSSATATPLTGIVGSDTIVDFDLAAGAHISGSVTGGGSPLADNVTVYLYDSTGDYINAAYTDASGNYTLPGLYDGDYQVYFDPGYYNWLNTTEFLSEYYQDAHDSSTLTLVTVSGGTSAEGINADLEVGGSISGVVTGDGGPLADYVYVDVYDTNGNWVRETQTGADGSYSVTGLLPGDYKVAFNPYQYNAVYDTSFLEEWYDNVRDSASATLVTTNYNTDTPNINADLEVGGSISGVVTGGGTPLASDMDVYVYDALTGDYVSSTSTALDGSYRVSGLLGGDYKVFFSAYWYNYYNSTSYLDEWYDAQRYEEDATPVTVTLGADTPGISATLDAGGSISGVVTGDGGPLASDVQVDLYDAASGAYLGSTWTGADGSYALSPLYAGDYMLKFDAGYYNAVNGTSFLTEWYEDARDREAATPVAVAVGADTPIDADLAVGGSISGTVTGDGGPLGPGVYVDVYDTASGNWMGDVATEADGTYTVGGLYAGNYQVVFSPYNYNADKGTDFLAEWYDNVRNQYDATPVAVTLGADTPGIDADLEIGGSISGVVTGGGGPVDNVWVYVVDATTGDWMDSDTTAADGTYKIRGLYPGSYKVRFDTSSTNWFNDTDYLSQWFDGVRYYDDATLVDVVAGADTPGIDAVLEIGGSISGTITGDGAPVADGIRVSVADAATGEWMSDAWTEPDGTYRVGSLYPGDYKVYVYAGDYNLTNATSFKAEWYDNAQTFAGGQQVAVAGETDTPGIDVDLETGAMITGTVTGDGGPLDGVWVTAYSPTLDQWLDGYETGADGTYKITGLYPGEYKLNFDPGNHNWSYGTAFLGEWYDNVRDFDEATLVPVVGTTDVSAIDADLELGATITGTVTGDGGVGLGGVLVTIRDAANGDSAGQDWTNSVGEYVTQGLLPGSYVVEFNPSEANLDRGTSYVREFWDNVATFGAATPLVADFAEVLSGKDAQLSQGGATISGTVYDPDGVTPLGGVSVYAAEQVGVSSSWLGEAVTGTDGTYTIAGLPAGPKTLDFWADGYKEMLYNEKPWSDDGDGMVFADFFPVAEGQDVTGMDAVMQLPATLTGSVVDTLGAGIPDIDVTLWYDGGDKGWHPVHTHGTWNDGTVEFSGDWCGLLAGDYKVEFSDTTGDLGSAWYLNSPDAQDATITVAAAGGTITLEPQLLPLLSTSVEVLPISGSNRIGTAIAASKEAYPAGADTVIIATGYNWPDALGGAALAGAVDGPVLLTAPTSLPAEVLAEITRLGAGKAYILGGTSAIGTPVENALKSKLGAANVTRLSGANRYATAAKVASETVNALGAAYDGTAFVATGANFPDALGASPLAAAKGWPIFLVNPLTGVDATLVTAMKDVGVTNILPLGGTTVISAAAENALKTQLPATSKRLSGSNRFATALEVAKYGVEQGMVWNRVAITTGQNFPDALAGGVLQGKSNSVMLLTQSTVLYPDVAATLTANKTKIWEVRFLGGTNAVSAAVRAAVGNALATP